MELAFVAAMQHLPARQRAVLILREVLGFSAKEVGETLDTSVPSVNSALQRARQAVEDKVPERSQQMTLRELGDARLREIVEDYMEAMRNGDVNRVVSSSGRPTSRMAILGGPTTLRIRPRCDRFSSDSAFPAGSTEGSQGDDFSAAPRLLPVTASVRTPDGQEEDRT